jgi:hypothetical protein
MMLTLLKIQDFMSKAIQGDTDVSLNSLSAFAEECKDSVERQLTRQKGEWRIRMSGIGRPMCQQLLDKQGIEEEMEYNTLFRFLFGDITESILMLVMKEAGVDIVDFQRPVELDLDGVPIKGTLDVIIRDESGVEKVWDIKSASDWAFKNKFTNFGGYEKLKEDDPFGYLMQGFLYGEATGLPFGGWIVVNKSSGEVAVVESGDWSGEDKEHYIALAKERVKQLSDPKTKLVKYPDEFETYRKDGEIIRTGNKVLARPCHLCGYRHHCWPKSELHPKVTSRAKTPPMTWYSKLTKKEV